MIDEEKIPLSYLSQYYFCSRRAGLIMLEQVWQENQYTAEGRAKHESVHTNRVEKRGKQIKIYEQTVTSGKLQLSGKCDCIEGVENKNGAKMPFLEGTYQLFPVEYKHGRVRNEEEYNIQLCAQAMCLEEMFDCQIDQGAIFYIDAHRRIEIDLEQNLREKVYQGSQYLKKMMETGRIPKAKYGPKCKKCSLLEYCGPKVQVSGKKYMEQLRNTVCEEGDCLEEIK